jgi:putative ABC transport system ATP-binding protein
MKKVLEVRNLSKNYGKKGYETAVLKDISMDIYEGDFIAIMGPSGAGKTTFLNMLSTLDKPSSGKILLEGQDITALSNKELSLVRRDKIGFIFQEYNLLDTLTLEENVMLAMSLRKEKKSVIEKQCQDMLKLLGIEEVKNQFPYQVSGGQKQRCACARALVNHPKLILADEPTGALDSRAAQTLLETFTKLNRELKATIFMVTHDAFSASYCGRILFLKDGKIFHELMRGEKTRREFLNEILDVLSLTGGEA